LILSPVLADDGSNHHSEQWGESSQLLLFFAFFMAGATRASRPQMLRKAVYFECQNKVVVRQAAERIRRESHGHIVVGQKVKIRVMTLVLFEHSSLCHKPCRLSGGVCRTLVQIVPSVFDKAKTNNNFANNESVQKVWLLVPDL
jgi:hypothetical protein